jgi:HAD superfamily hydrolase (TIGR01509 family)
VRATTEILGGADEGLLDYYYQLRATGLEEPGTARLLRELLTRHSIPCPESSLRKALAAMYAVTQTNWFVEDDAIATLEQLRSAGIRQGVVSNGSDDENARRLLENGHLDRYFEFVLTSAAFGRRKPDPSIFRAALAQFAARPDEAVMVGNDYDADIAGARAIGMRTIWVTRRVPPAQFHAAPASEAKASRLAQIPALIS